MVPLALRDRRKPRCTDKRINNQAAGRRCRALFIGRGHSPQTNLYVWLVGFLFLAEGRFPLQVKLHLGKLPRHTDAHS